MLSRYFKEDAGCFDTDATRAMSQAFTDACNALRVFNGDERGREAIAVRIVELARSGVVDAKALRERLLAEASVSI
jgi:hypothetical protein